MCCGVYAIAPLIFKGSCQPLRLTEGFSTLYINKGLDLNASSDPKDPSVPRKAGQLPLKIRGAGNVHIATSYLKNNDLWVHSSLKKGER